MKKYVLFLALIFTTGSVFALETVFDSMDNAKEVSIKPAITTERPATTTTNAGTHSNYSGGNKTLQVQRFNEALINLDDAQVELRQELSAKTSKYNEALIEKEKAIANCKQIKSEINEINKKMKNVNKSKKMINKNLEILQ